MKTVLTAGADALSVVSEAGMADGAGQAQERAMLATPGPAGAPTELPPTWKKTPDPLGLADHGGPALRLSHPTH